MQCWAAVWAAPPAAPPAAAPPGLLIVMTRGAALPAGLCAQFTTIEFSNRNPETFVKLRIQNELSHCWLSRRRAW